MLNFLCSTLHRCAPIFRRCTSVVHGRPLVYLDNAATTQKPRAVIDRIVRYYERENANVHRGVHHLSQVATDAMEAARTTVARFFGATDAELIFTRGTTEGLNLIAHAWGQQHVRAGDEVLVTDAEHHSNFVPWQRLCAATGATLRVVPVEEDGTLSLERFAAMLSERTRLVAFAHITGAFGVVNPVAELARLAHDVGALVVVDGAQGAPHATARHGRARRRRVRRLRPQGVRPHRHRRPLRPRRCAG